MANPSFTYTLDDATISTMETYVEKQRMAVNAEHTLWLAPIFNLGMMPGLVGEKPIVSGISQDTVQTVAGRELRMPVAYGSSTNTQDFRHTDVLDTNIDDVGTSQRAIYPYKTDFAAISLTESLENQGTTRNLDLWKDRVDQAVRTMMESLEADALGTQGDTNETSQKTLIGLQAMLPDTTTSGTIWGIDRSTYTWQRPNSSDAGGDFNTSSLGLTEWTGMMVSCAGTSGVDMPTAIYTTSVIWKAYAQEVYGNWQITPGQRQDLGVSVLYFMDRPVFWSNNIATGKSHFINHRYLKAYKQPGADFQLLDYGPAPNQAIAYQRRWFAALQQGFTRYDRQGTVYGFTDT